ncbi:hypothetical protein [Micromonospora globbae]|uniref:hypothetical protein n=1 Tax=Micromonospora globbae TaxID=1894969 RepID=UPI0034303213
MFSAILRSAAYPAGICTCYVPSWSRSGWRVGKVACMFVAVAVGAGQPVQAVA